MRILLVTQLFPPEPQRVLTELTTGLRDQGHDVTVLTGFPNFPSGKLYPGYRIRWIQRETLDGIPVIRVPLFPDHSQSALWRSLNILSFAFFAALIGPFVVPKIDVVHVLHPPATSALPGWIISRLKGVRFTYEIQDMWPESLKATGLLNNERALSLIGWFNKWVYRRADAIRVITDGFRTNLIEKGVPPEKIHVISNWVDTQWYRPCAADEDLEREHGLDGRFNIMFAGVMGPAQALDVVIDAASLLRDLPDVQFVLVGGGNDVEALRGAVTDRKLDNVLFLGQHPPDMMPRFFAAANVLFLHLRKDPLFKITIPHKTFAYMASAKPVLAAIEGDVAAVVERAGAGLTCPSGDPESLAATVRQLHAMTAAERAQMGKRGRDAACRLFARDACIGQLGSMIESVVKRTVPAV